MYLDEYKIEGTVNNDQNPCFNNAETYPKFQENLEKSYSWFDLSQMTEVCASCGSENLEDNQ